ncbi:MAG: amidase [Verrucomicrobia bacterium]|nr:amidase [Verrucomicrobiota bacterium]
MHMRKHSLTRTLTCTWSILILVVGLPLWSKGSGYQSVPLGSATIKQLQSALDAGTITSEKLVQMYLTRISTYDEQLKSVIVVATNALDQARALDSERKISGKRSLLHGIPMVFKDTVDTIDAPTAGGCLGLAGTYPLDDATLVRKLKDAGVIVLAKTNLDEFNRGAEGLSSLGGQVINPYDSTRNPGGSSAGTGVAVNCWFATAGIGTETGASIRSPASNNSLVALAPTQGLISRAGLIAISFTQDRGGPHARSVEDAAIVASHMIGLDSEDLFTHASIGQLPKVPYYESLNIDALKGARLGVFRDLFRKGSEFEEINNLIEAQIQWIGSQGAVIMDGLTTGMDLVKFFPSARASNYEFREAFRGYLASRGPNTPFASLEELYTSGQFLPKLATRYAADLAAGPTPEFDPAYLARLKNRETVRQMIIDLMDKYQVDALIHPFKSLSAPPIGTSDRGPRDNPVSAITGLPAIVVPAGVNSEGLPISIELLGRPFSEPTLFSLAYAYEQSTRHRTPPPKFPALMGESILVPNNP